MMRPGIDVLVRRISDLGQWAPGRVRGFEASRQQAPVMSLKMQKAASASPRTLQYYDARA